MELNSPLNYLCKMYNETVRSYSRAIHEGPHDILIARKRYRRKNGKGKLQTHHGIQNIIQVSQIIDAAEERCEESGNHGDASGKEHSLPSLPSQIEESFHGELACVCSCHGRALTSS